MLSWFSHSSRGESSAVLQTPEQNTRNLEEVLFAAQLVFEDDLDGAESTLDGGDSPYHQLGKGLLVILKGALGFEEDRNIYNELVTKAGNLLDTAEASSEAVLRQTPKSEGRSMLYQTGVDLKLCDAEAKLANAVRASISEKMAEYLRGLVKLRKSYMALKAIIDEEAKYIANPDVYIDSSLTGTPEPSPGIDIPEPDFHNSIYTGVAPVERTTRGSTTDASQQFPCLDLYPNSPLLSSTSDKFAYSGSHLCFGAMLIILSMVPTAFQQVLKMIGFRGDKEIGYRMLWQATRFHNIHGASAGLLLLSLYNAIRVACDIADGVVYPQQKCAELLQEMQRRYPKSLFWTMEEARMLASDGRLVEAIEVLKRPMHNPVKQLVALSTIERSLYYMFIHDFEACSQGFIESVTLSKYSQALYYYDAACSQVELYRKYKDSDLRKASVHKEKANEWLETAMNGVDRKQLYATELPFDAFVVRKINKWKQRALKRKIDLVDAIGVSPVEEMIYMYGGHKWMTPAQLDESMQAIEWSQQTPNWETEDIDERCIFSFLKAVVERNRGNLTAAKIHLNAVLEHEWKDFKIKGCDNWPLPSAHYEMAIISWVERDGEDPAGKIRETERLLKKVTKWDSYELDFRITLKAKSAQDVVANFKSDRTAKVMQK